MFFVGCEINGKLGVVDTDDFVVEFFTPQELTKFNVNIVGYDVISLDYMVQYPLNLMIENEYNKFRINSALKLYRSLLRDEDFDIVSGHYVVGIHDVLYYINKCRISKVLKCFSYAEKYGMFILVFEVTDGVSNTLALCRVMSDGNILTKVLPADKRYYLSTYPVGSGYLYSRYCNSIPQDRLYIKLNQIDTKITLFEINNFTPVFAN